MPARIINPKLSADEEEALLKSLRAQREAKSKAVLQAEAQALARKLGDVAIEKVPDEAAPLVVKDKKNFGTGDPQGGVIAITLNAVLLSASVAGEEDDNGKGGKKKPAGKGGGKKNAKPKIGAKVERLPPPTGDAATEAIVKHKATLAKVIKATPKFDAKEGQQSLLLAFESWLCNEYNESVLPAAPQLLKALCDEGLLEGAMLAEYWAKVLSTVESDAKVCAEAKVECEQAVADLKEAEDQLKVSQDEDTKAAQQLKWASAETLNARTGNQPTADEAAREKAAGLAEGRMRSDKLAKTKGLELAHKKQVAALNARETADRSLAEKVAQARTCELMQKHGEPFFAALVAGIKGGYTPDKAPEAPGSA